MSGLFTIILTSGLVSAATTGIFSFFIAKNKYNYDYYKTIIDKRLFAYEQLEVLIATLKMSIVDNEPRPYHILFFDVEESAPFSILTKITNQSLWLSDKALREVITLNRMVYTMPKNSNDAKEWAKTNYQNIAELRTRLEKIVAKDFKNLHKIKKFLKRKRPIDAYEQLPNIN